RLRRERRRAVLAATAVAVALGVPGSRSRGRTVSRARVQCGARVRLPDVAPALRSRRHVRVRALRLSRSTARGDVVARTRATLGRDSRRAARPAVGAQLSRPRRLRRRTGRRRRPVAARRATTARGRGAASGERSALGKARRRFRARIPRAGRDRLERGERDPARVPRLGRDATGRRRWSMVKRFVLLGVVAASLAAASGAGAAERPIQLVTAVSPGPHFFGDPIHADVDILIDTKRVDPKAVRLDTKFDPYTRLARPQRIRSDDGSTTRLRYLYLLTCDTFVCLTGDKTERMIHFAPATIRYRDRHGKAGKMTARWPRFRFVSRFGGPRYLPQTA